MPSGTLYRVALVRTDVSENALSPSSEFFGVICFHSCVSVESLLVSLPIKEEHLWPKNTVLWNALTRVSIVDASWDFEHCSSSSNRRFGKNISNFVVP
jgi:hypothetical protein